MMKRFLVLGWALLVWGIGSPIALAGETRDEALPAKSDTLETVIKAEKKDHYWRTWDLGLRSTYFQMTSRQGYGNINRIDEQQDYTPTNLFLSYNFYGDFALVGEAFLKPLVGRTRNRDVAFSDGDLEFTPYLLSVQGRIPTRCRFKPYLSFGVAYITTGFNAQPFYRTGYESPEHYNQYFATSGVLKVRQFLLDDYVWGFHFGVGSDFFISKHFSLNVDLKYLVGKVNFKYQIYEGDTLVKDDRGQYYLDTLFVGLGLRYSF